MSLTALALTLVSVIGLLWVSYLTWQVLQWHLNRGAADHSPEDDDA